MSDPKYNFDAMQLIVPTAVRDIVYSAYHDSVSSGVCDYNGSSLPFLFSHEFDCGDTHVVFVDGVAAFYFSLYPNEDTGKCDSLVELD